MRSLEARLQKIEAAFGPSPSARFYVFGIDGAEIEGRAAEAVRIGSIRPGHDYRGVLWRGTAPLPDPRWATPADLSDEELEDAIAALAAQTGYEVQPRGAMEGVTLFATLRAVQADLKAEFSGLKPERPSASATS